MSDSGEQVRPRVNWPDAGLFEPIAAISGEHSGEWTTVAGWPVPTWFVAGEIWRPRRKGNAGKPSQFFHLTLRIECTGGLPRLVRFEVGGIVDEDGNPLEGELPEVTADVMRQVMQDLPTIVRRLVVNWAPGRFDKDPEQNPDDEYESYRFTPFPGVVEQMTEDLRRAGSRRRYSPQLLQLVADAYREDPVRPRQNVARRLFVADSTASQMIRAARQAGKLGPVRGKGLKGEATS